MAGQRKQYPSQARLRELFDYDPEGFLVWKYNPDRPQKWNSRRAGEKAGCATIDGSGSQRNQISINGEKYEIRNLIWIYFNGAIEEGFFITNRDGSKLSCRIENMAIGKKTRNPRLLRPKGGGFYGIQATHNGTWQAKIGDNGLGHFSTEIEAATAYDNAKEGADGTRPNGTERQVVERIPTTIPRRKTKTKGTQKKPNGRYSAKISVAGKFKSLGTFDTQEQAARAYNIAAYEHYGEHAVLNDIPDPLGYGDVF